MSKSLISYLVILSLAIVHSSTAFAIRSVGNGGGLAEMRTIYLLQNLNRFLRVCMTSANSCALTADTFSEWSKIYNEKPSEQNDYVVSFVTEPVGEKGFAVQGLNLTISHQMLYVDLKTPKNLGELLAFVVSVKQDLIGSQFSYQENLKIASAVFKDLSIEEKNHKVLGASTQLNLSQLKVYDGLTFHLIMGLEDQDKTVNLYSYLEKSIPCGHVTDWAFDQWSSEVYSTSVYFYGNASAICNGNSVQKRILIKAGLDNKFLVDESKITVGFFVN